MKTKYLVSLKSIVKQRSCCNVSCCDCALHAKHAKQLGLKFCRQLDSTSRVEYAKSVLDKLKRERLFYQQLEEELNEAS